MEELTLLYQSYNAPLECPVTRTQQRGTEPARSDSFSYNGRNELTAATLGAAPYGYSYDNIGNRKTAREPAGELAYAANGLNQYTGIEESGEAPFVPTYDASGNQTLIKTSTGVWTVVYNAANRAVSFTSRDGATVVECGYDYQGRRYMKKVTQNGTVASHERYLYRGYLQLAALDMLDNRNVLRTLLWDPLEPVATRPLALVQGASLYCYGVDFNKNVTEVFDAQGTIAAAYDYSPYGAVTGTGSLGQPVQWSGEMHDEEPVLAYYNYRFYNPKDGRWINRDPIAEQGGLNLYCFLINYPPSIDYLGKIAIVLVIPLTITAAEATAYAAIAAAAICLSNSYCSKLATAAFVAPILAAVAAAKAISSTICSIRCRFGNHGAHHSFRANRIGIPSSIRCWKRHLQSNCWISGASGSNFGTIRIPYGDCYKNRNGNPPGRWSRVIITYPF